MNVIDSKFNVPDYVSCADPDKLNVSGDGAVVVEGMRIDNQAAAWVAKSEILKRANEFSHYAKSKVDEACKLFGITEDSFVEKEASSDYIEISDGDVSVVFSVVDNDTLNKAASELIAKRSELSYLFAKDCAEALRKVAFDNGFSFSDENQVVIKKMSGAYHVAQDRLKGLVDHTINLAASVGLDKYASELGRIKNIVTEDYPVKLVPLVLEAIDQVNKALPLNKKASADIRHPEDVVYMTNKEAIQKAADALYLVDDNKYISGSKLSSSLDSIVKWASDSGYTVTPDAKPDDVASTVRAMPGLLRKEFWELFG